MAATLTELESALNSLTTRIEQIERLIANLVSTRQLNQISLIVESDIGDLQFNIESDDVYNGAWATSLVFGKSHNITKKGIMEKLSEMNFPVRPFNASITSCSVACPICGVGSADVMVNAAV